MNGNEQLSPREQELLRLLSHNGYSNKELANSLNITEDTIKVHIKTICRKLRLKTRVHLVIHAWATGFVSNAG